MIPKDLDVEEKHNINDNIIEKVTVTKETYGDHVLPQQPSK